MNRYLRLSCLVFGCWVLFLISGCSKNVTVKGTVTFPDGTPLTKGTVVFESAVTRVSSPLNTKGEYSLGGLKNGDGVPFGVYNGWIQGAIADPPPLPQTATRGPAPPARRIPRREPLIDEKYMDGKTSGLSLEISKAGTIVNNITVDYPPNK